MNVPLCEKECLTSILKISGPGTAGAQRKRLLDLYPAATFGDTLQAVQPDQAQGAIGDVDSDKPSVPLTDTVEFYYIAKLKPASPPALTSKDTEESLDNEDYPLPLGWPHPQAQVHRVTKSKLLFSTSALTLDLGASKKVVNRRASALFARQDRKATPLHVSARTAGLQRFINPVQTDASTVAEPPKDAAIISVPGSPARRAELFGVNLRIVPPHSPVSLKRQRLETLSAAKNLERRALTPRDGARGTFNTSLNIEAGKAAWIDLTGGTPVRGTLAFAGQQTVRAIFLAATGEPLGDVYVAGARSLQAPPRTRRAVFIGEGLDAPLRAPAATAAAAEEEAAARVATAFPREAIGIEHDSVLLALGNGVFAGHGCILKANTSLGIAPQPLDSAPGSQVLRAATNVRVHFPALRKGWSLVLSVEPLVAEPGSAVREIRWRSLDAKLDGLHSVLTPDRTALLMSVEAAKPWSLEIDLGKKWRLAGIALVGREPRDIARTFKSKADWDLVDDRFRAAPPRTSTNITMQITQ